MTNINFEDKPNAINDLNAACDDVECEVASLREKFEQVNQYNIELEAKQHEAVSYYRSLEVKMERLEEENKKLIEEKHEQYIENLELRRIIKRWA